MTLISVLLSLLLDRNLHMHRDSPVQGWFGAWLEMAVSRLPGTRAGMAALLLVVLPPVLLVAFLQWLFVGWLFGLVSLVFAIVVLLFSLGPLDVAESADKYIEAAHDDDAERTGWYYQSVTAETDVDGSEPSAGRNLAAALYYQAHDHLFATLFWFCVLGPFGAVFHRVVVEAALRPGPALIARPGLQRSARDALGVLGWIPARLLALGFAMTGSFDSAWRAVRAQTGTFPDLLESNRQLLVTAGTAAMRAGGAADAADDRERRSDDAAQPVMLARGLIMRAFVFWLALLALMTLAGWLG